MALSLVHNLIILCCSKYGLMIDSSHELVYIYVISFTVSSYLILLIGIQTSDILGTDKV